MAPIVLAPPIVASPVQDGANSAPTAAAATAMANAVMQQLENITTNVNNTSANGESGSAERAPEQVSLCTLPLPVQSELLHIFWLRSVSDGAWT